MQNAFTILITGLPSSGKTTTASLLKKKLEEKKINLEFFDGDEIRKNICSDLGFSREDRIKNAERINFLAKLLNKHGVSVIISVIAPFKEMREKLKSEIANYVEVFLKCPLEVCEKRDSKGLYKIARSGIIKDFTGISSVYEEPDNPDLICDTENEKPEQCVLQIIKKLEDLKLIKKDNLSGYSSEEEEQIKNQLKNLGYF